MKHCVMRIIVKVVITTICVIAFALVFTMPAKAYWYEGIQYEYISQNGEKVISITGHDECIIWMQIAKKNNN